ncbi:hypothetical protein IV203_037711 [Nitzschia inconspicua]|uniref:Uncharacterized protein n=1 Tax=Nitzschia inconspicua TaxID=303405 RepID=A0A9K3LMH4_9STRA|nr:hypothetical protein IV203_037711 [Nitzschia inconspicua]
MPAESLLTGKRSAADCIGENQHAGKKGRLNGTTAPYRVMPPPTDGVIATFTPTKFTHVHLKLLKALYPQQDLEQDDGSVKQEQWKHMERFLQNREEVKTMSAQVKVSEVIHDESMAFEELVENSPSIVTTGTNFVPSPQPSAAARWSAQKMLPSLSNHSSASKYKRALSARFFSCADRYGSSSSSPGNIRYSARKQNQESPIDVDANPFGILSSFLKHKHQETCRRFHQFVSPIQELANDAERRVQSLTLQLKETAGKIKQAGMNAFLLDPTESRHPSVDVATLEEERVRMETKLDLWTILWKDITATMK